MTDNEIIKALECCTIIGVCDNCPFYNKASCGLNLRRDALTLINRQGAEIEQEKKNLRTMFGEKGES